MYECCTKSYEAEKEIILEAVVILLLFYCIIYYIGRKDWILLDHELKIIRDTNGWKAAFICGTEKKELNSESLQDIIEQVELWLVSDKEEN